MTTPRNHVNAGVTVLIAPSAQPHHLRDMAATLTERAQQMEARGPASPSDDAAFLARMMDAALFRIAVTAEDVDRLRRLADWADAAPPAGWNGTLDKHETARAIQAARERMGHA